MISKIHLHQIGPAPDLEAEFGERLNLITGDSGLGKSFLLDACWYALTNTWADGKSFFPTPDVSKKDPPRISYKIASQTANAHSANATSTYEFASQAWRNPRSSSLNPGLVLYVRVDGGFSLWDPARNGWLGLDNWNNAAEHFLDCPPAFQFSSNQVWDGLEEDQTGQKKTICNGLLRDVETWRLKGNGAFQLLQNILKGISSGEEETLSIGEGVRVRIDDAKDIPTLKMPYGLVPVTHAAAGMRRILALAYMLVWTWDEHCRVSELEKERPANRIVMLFDEIESHLHPKWQRVFLPSLLEVVKALLFNSKPQSVQIIATTHAPLVLASVEAAWSAQQDRLFDFKLVEGNRVCFEEVEFARQGSASNWLTSSSFALQSDYAVAAEKAMRRADELMRRYPHAEQAPREESEAIHNDLKSSLGGDDEYWPYWLPYYEATKRVA
jgi:predicted ATPase